MSAVFGQANRNNNNNNNGVPPTNNNNGNNGEMGRPEMDRRMNNGTGMNGMGGAMNGGEMPQFQPGQNNGTNQQFYPVQYRPGSQAIPGQGQQPQGDGWIQMRPGQGNQGSNNGQKAIQMFTTFKTEVQLLE